MKSRISFACLVVIMAFSTFAMGTIVQTQDWTGSGDVIYGDYVGSIVQATASGAQTTEYSYGYGWWQLLTTEAGEFDWSYDLKAGAYTHIFYEDVNDAWAEAYGWGQVILEDFTEPDDLTNTAFALIEDEDCESPPDLKYAYYYPEDMEQSWYDDFDANDKIRARHQATAEASITEDSDSETYAWAEGAAAITLEEHQE